MMAGNLILPAPEHIEGRNNNDRETARFQDSPYFGGGGRVVRNMLQNVGGQNEGEAPIAKGNRDGVGQGPGSIAGISTKSECFDGRIESEGGTV